MTSAASFWPSLVASTLALVGLAVLSVMIGPESVDPQYTLYQVRLPRFLTGAALGAALALAGNLLQLATQNPLSEPELLGINQSAVFAVVVLLLIAGSASATAILVAALVGGALSGTAILLMTSSGAFPRERLILAGLTLAFFFGSASSGLLILKESDLFELLHWTAGKLSGAGWSDFALCISVLAVAVVLSILRASAWNALQLGEEGARSLGLDPVTLRVEMMVITVCLCSVAVAVAGPIGFVGIIIPHLSRLLAGLDYRFRVPLSLLTGAILVAGADLLARSVIHPVEIPVGIVTALLGAPYFLYRAQRAA